MHLYTCTPVQYVNVVCLHPDSNNVMISFPESDQYPPVVRLRYWMSSCLLANPAARGSTVAGLAKKPSEGNYFHVYVKAGYKQKRNITPVPFTERRCESESKYGTKPMIKNQDSGHQYDTYTYLGLIAAHRVWQ